MGGKTREIVRKYARYVPIAQPHAAAADCRHFLLITWREPLGKLSKCVDRCDMDVKPIDVYATAFTPAEVSSWRTAANFCTQVIRPASDWMLAAAAGSGDWAASFLALASRC